MKNICVIGLGYIGLPTASLFANNGFHVLGVDTNPEIVEVINKGKIHIEEVGLRTLVEAAVSSGQLKAASEPANADVFIICVPTPFKEDKKPDVSYVFEAAGSILPYLRPGNLVVVESTVPPGITEKVADFVAKKRADLIEAKRKGAGSLNVFFAHCPERVLPGKILKELVENDRVIGGLGVEATRLACEIYGRIVSGRIYQTDATTAEMVKLAENTFRDVNISLSNELALICQKLGINGWEVINLANKHPRVRILNPGPGVGGHCIAVDPWFIVSEFPEESQVIKAARLRNDAIPELVVKMIMGLIKKETKPKIACLGAAYKGNVGDARNSPAVDIYRMLAARLKGKAEVVISDMHVEDSKLPLQPVDDAINKASMIVLLADHEEYKELDPVEVAKKMKGKILLDTRNQLDHSRWRSAGFDVHLLGDGSARRS